MPLKLVLDWIIINSLTVLALREGHMASLRKIVVQTKVGPEKKVDSLLLKNRMNKRFFLNQQNILALEYINKEDLGQPALR